MIYTAVCGERQALAVIQRSVYGLWKLHEVAFLPLLTLDSVTELVCVLPPVAMSELGGACSETLEFFPERIAGRGGIHYIFFEAVCAIVWVDEKETKLFQRNFRGRGKWKSGTH